MGGHQEHTCTARRWACIIPLFMVACTPAPEPKPPPHTRDVIVITLDTTRADHLPVYGYDRDTAPHITALAQQGVVIEQLRAPIPLTTPSHATLFTGLAPMHHTVRANYGSHDRLPDSVDTLAEDLQSRGWQTGAFVAAFPAGRAGGLGQGFDTFKEPTEVERPANEVVDEALGWLGGRTDAPFFLWVHLFDPHGAYVPPPEHVAALGVTLSPEDAAPQGGHRSPANDVLHYDGEIRFADHQIGRLLSAVRAMGRPEPLILLTADHGETLTERTTAFQHGHTVYEEQLHVPGIMVGAPLPRGERAGGMFELADLRPTLLSLLGLPVPPGLDGDNRSPDLLKPQASPTFVGSLPTDAELAQAAFAESMPCTLAKGMRCGPEGPRGKLRAVRAGRWKLIFTPHPEGARFELYRLDQDPGETQNLIEAAPQAAQKLLKLLTEHVKEDRALR